jgi:CRP-like cAMP-binding protein
LEPARPPELRNLSTVEELLGRVPLFSRLDPKHLRTLAASTSERTYPPGDLIVAHGTKGTGFYFIAEGRVEVEKGDKVIATLGPGQFFGEMALLYDETRTADVRAASRTRCIVLAPWMFWGTVGDDPEALRVLLREVVRRLRESLPTPED